MLLVKKYQVSKNLILRISIIMKIIIDNKYGIIRRYKIVHGKNIERKNYYKTHDKSLL